MTKHTRWMAVLTLLVLSLASGLKGQGAKPTSTAELRPPAAPPSASDGYRIGQEDVLDISVWGQAELTRTVQVRPDGKISLPLVNDVQAATLTPMELRAVLAKGLLESDFIRNPEVSVMVREVNSLKVSVIGQVRTSGRFTLRSRMTILDALAMAGGFTDFARKDEIRLQRRDSVVSIPFDKLVDRADIRANLELQAGDIIIVP